MFSGRSQTIFGKLKRTRESFVCQHAIVISTKSSELSLSWPLGLQAGPLSGAPGRNPGGLQVLVQPGGARVNSNGFILSIYSSQYLLLLSNSNFLQTISNSF